MLITTILCIRISLETFKYFIYQTTGVIKCFHGIGRLLGWLAKASSVVWTLNTKVKKLIYRPSLSRTSVNVSVKSLKNEIPPLNMHRLVLIYHISILYIYICIIAKSCQNKQYLSVFYSGDTDHLSLSIHELTIFLYV